MKASIRARIILFYLALLAVMLGALGFMLDVGLNRMVYDAVDDALETKAKALATLVSNDPDEEEFQFSDAILWEYHSPHAKSFFQLRSADGSALEKSKSLGSRNLPWEPGEGDNPFSFIRVGSAAARMVTLSFPPPRGPANRLRPALSKGFIVQCAQSVREQQSLVRSYRFLLVGASLSVLILTAAGGFLIATRALRPVKEMSRTVSRISDANLSERIGHQSIPQELQSLALCFNRTLDGLEEAFHQQKRFVSDASHELRTPISVLVSQSEITLRRDRDPSEYRESLEAILQTSRMMSHLVQKLLTLAGLSAETNNLQMERTELSHVLMDAAQLLASEAAAQSVELNLDVPPGVYVNGDRSLLTEVFVNLIDNAIKYNVPAGKVNVSLGTDSDEATAVVADTGIGIPPQDMDKVFGRFYRVDPSRSRKSGGAGLGLSIAREIVTLHGGRIEMQSSLGTGTQIRVRLPSAYRGDWSASDRSTQA